MKNLADASRKRVKATVVSLQVNKMQTLAVNLL